MALPMSLRSMLQPSGTPGQAGPMAPARYGPQAAPPPMPGPPGMPPGMPPQGMPPGPPPVPPGLGGPTAPFAPPQTGALGADPDHAQLTREMVIEQLRQRAPDPAGMTTPGPFVPATATGAARRPRV